MKREIMKEKTVQEKFLSFKELKAQFYDKPKVDFLFSGIKEKSFGLVFGPSKSGKTIFCENLAMHIAIGSKKFFGLKLKGEPRKVLFVGLEEFWENRVERNLKQFVTLTDDEKALYENNFLSQNIEFSKYIHSKDDWTNLRCLIESSKAEVVFIDSITRMNHGVMEDSKTAEQIMQNLRSICYDLGITLICIHHTPKMHDSILSMDKIKGSSVFAQESDFAIGVNRTSKGHRYMKNVFFRYASDDFERVDEFLINESICVEKIKMVTEEELLSRTDRRKSDENKNKIYSFFENNTTNTELFSTKELVKEFESYLSIKKRQIQNILSELVNEGKLNNPKKGFYNLITPENE